MNKMLKPIQIEQIIPQEQREVAKILSENIFSRIPKGHFFLVGGTAVALKYGHRQSIDFDFFSFPKQWIDDHGDVHINYDQEILDQVDKLLRSEKFHPRKDMAMTYGQLQYEYGEVGITFLAFQNMAAQAKTDIYHVPQFPLEKEMTPLGFETLSIKDLAGMKAFARTRRSKMKDIVDIAEILRHGEVSLKDILKIAEKQFGYDISKKEILIALACIDDILENPIDEKIEYVHNRDNSYYINILKKECLNLYNGDF